MTLFYLLVTIISCVALAVGVSFVLVKKHRIIWNRLWAHEEQIAELKFENIQIRKELCLSCLPPARLEPKMPSQHGEDLWLWDYFNHKQEGFFVEVGAYDGVTFSNTYLLEAMGWSGILIEPNPDNVRKCIERRPYSTCINAAVTDGTEQELNLSVVTGNGGVDALSFTHPTGRHLNRVAKSKSKVVIKRVPAVRLTTILEEVDEAIDLISIDVEGAELNVLQSLDFDKHAPEVFVIEDNSLGRDNQVECFLHAKGYNVCGRCGAKVLFKKGRSREAEMVEETPEACID